MSNKNILFDTLISQYQTEIFRFLVWHCGGDRALAEDLTQDTFLRAWRFLDSLEDQNKARAWLYTIARRETLRRYERKQLDTVDIDDVAEPVDMTQTPEGATERDQIVAAINTLDEIYREPLLLQLISGLNGNEIAEMLGVERATVTTRIFRAKRKLADMLSTVKN